jgi:hypothetical protein
MSITVPAWTPISAPTLSGAESAAPRATDLQPTATHRRHSHAAHIGSWTLRNATTTPRTPRGLSKPKPTRRPLAKIAQPWSGDESDGALQASQTASGTEDATRRIEASNAPPDGYDSEHSDSDDRKQREAASGRASVAHKRLADDAATGQGGRRLAHVKQALIDKCATSIAANRATGPTTVNYYLLLPLELLNAARPRTAAQSEAARGRLALLARASIGGKVIGGTT